MHNWPGLPAGAFGVCSGPMMSAANAFKITVTGRGGHAAAPQDCDAPAPAVLAIGQALQTILTRRNRPLEYHLISNPPLHAGHQPAARRVGAECVLARTFTWAHTP